MDFPARYFLYSSSWQFPKDAIRLQNAPLPPSEPVLRIQLSFASGLKATVKPETSASKFFSALNAMCGADCDVYHRQKQSVYLPGRAFLPVKKPVENWSL